MVNTFEKTKIEVFRMNNSSENNDFGAILKRNLESSQFYIVEKTPNIAISFYFSLVEPAAVFTLTKRSMDFYYELQWPTEEAREAYYRGYFDMDAVSERARAMKDRPMWVDDTEIQSVKELCEICRQMKKEHRIQFAVIDDLQKLLLPKGVSGSRIKRDKICQQLCLLARELEIAVVAFTPMV